MEYTICLWRKPTSSQAEMKDTARDADPMKAIKSFLKGRNIKYASLVCAYPANKKGHIVKVFCKDVRCSVSGRFTIQRTYIEHVEVP